MEQTCGQENQYESTLKLVFLNKNFAHYEFSRWNNSIPGMLHPHLMFHCFVEINGIQCRLGLALLGSVTYRLLCVFPLDLGKKEYKW